MIHQLGLQVADVDRTGALSLQVFAPVHAAAVAAGVEVLHAPREWPACRPGCYGVLRRDPDGHDGQAVHRG